MGKALNEIALPGLKEARECKRESHEAEFGGQ
jgi:hypothetical protein